jgi:hypothetical protein
MSNPLEISSRCRTPSYGEDMPSPFEMSVAETMVENKLQLKKVPSDGNCFFASLVTCHAALGKRSSARMFRHYFTCYLLKYKHVLAPFFSSEGGTEEEFVAAVMMIDEDRFWAHEVMDLVVGCATEVLRMNVTIFDIDQKGNVTKYEHVYNPQSDRPASPPITSGPRKPEVEVKVWPTIYLLRQDGNHFDALIPE